MTLGNPARWGLLGLLVAASAAAQPMQMPDVAQMSGTPRPDPAVPAGTLTVKVVRGEMAALAPVGTKVYLVAMSSKGEVAVQMREVNDEGRAEFTGLAVDGLTAYYPLAALGEDRLAGQAVVLPPKVGVRMMLAGAKAGEPPVDDEGRDHEGVNDAPAMPKAGEIEVLVRGHVSGGAKLSLRPLTGGEAREATLEGGDDDLRAVVKDVPAGQVYVAEVLAQKTLLRSTPFLTAAHAGVRRIIFGYDGLLFALQGGAQPDDEGLWFELRMLVANVSPAPFDPGPAGVLLPLPDGARSAKLQEDDPSFTIDGGQAVRARRAIPPGQVSADVMLSLPIENGQVDVAMAAPLGMFQSQLAVLKTDNMVLTPPAGTKAPDVRRADDGREYYVLADLQIAPGDALRFKVAGLPVPAHWEGWVRALAGVLVSLLVALGVVAATRRPRRRAEPATGADAKRELGQRRERLYAELVALERLRASQRIDASEFDVKRKAIMTKLVLVHREMDDLEAGA